MENVQVYSIQSAPKEFVERFSDFAVSRNPFLAVYEGIIPKLFNEEPTEESLATWVAEIKETRRVAEKSREKRKHAGLLKSLGRIRTRTITNPRYVGITMTGEDWLVKRRLI